MHFVIPAEFNTWLPRMRSLRLDVDYPYWLGGRFNWVAQAWLVLREYRQGLTIGSEPVPGRANFAHVQTWRALGGRQGEFRISFRADYPRLFDVDLDVVQNPSKTGNRKGLLYLPYWPIPGLISRRADRAVVRTVAYAGRLGPRNLANGLRDGQLINDHGFEFIVVPPDRWHDMSEVDVLVAVRSFDRKLYHGKPPSKLFHAWRAGVPLIAGWDSAYSAIGHPGRDYLRVESWAELQGQLIQLAQDQRAYKRLVRQGCQRAPEVSHEAIAQVWLEALEGPVSTAFERWKDASPNAVKGVIAKGADTARRGVSLANRLVGDRFGLN